MYEVEVALIAIMNMWSPAVCERFKLQQIFPGIHTYSCGAEHVCVLKRNFLESEEALTLHSYSISVSTCIRLAGCQKLVRI